jgi:NAD(P) transhydrogenase subunit alpha
MSTFFIDNQDLIYIVVLSVLLGIEVISNVPAILHTP